MADNSVCMPTRQPPRDAPFWAGVLFATFTVATVACFGHAAAIASNPCSDAAIVAIVDAPPPPR